MLLPLSGSPAPALEALVLCYHAVSDDWPSPLAVTQTQLARHLRLLQRRGYKFVTFSKLVNCLSRGAPKGNARIAAVTFDDGYRSNLTRALPVLREVGAPATVFVVTSFAGDGSPLRWEGITQWLGTTYERELEPLSPDDLRELVAAGWEIGSHTATHPRLSRLDDAAVREELCASKQWLEEILGVACRSLAYPYGDWNEQVAAIAAQAGYEAAALLSAHLSAPQPLAWPRIGIYRADSGWRFALKANPAVVRLRSTDVWRYLRAGRAISPAATPPSDSEVRRR